jgi:hypothetical protein
LVEFLWIGNVNFNIFLNWFRFLDLYWGRRVERELLGSKGSGPVGSPSRRSL